MVSAIFPDLGNTNSQFHNIFITLKVTPYPLAINPPIPSHLPTPSISNHKSTFSYIDLPILDLSYKWNHVTRGLLCLVSLTQCVFKVLPCSTAWFIPFYRQILFHRMDMPQQTCLPTHQVMDI